MKWQDCKWADRAASPNHACRPIGRILVLNNCSVLCEVKEVGQLFQNMQIEFGNQEIGYRVVT